MLFTSESVSDGHPDKICDQLSDAILDAFLAQDPSARVACEALVKTGLVVLAGEVKSTCHIPYEKIVRDVILSIGYDAPEKGLDAKGCAVICALGQQSDDISMAVDQKDQNQGAGDQGLMFGYATNETAHYMPAPIDYAHQIMIKHKALRTNHSLPWLRPDAKCQLSFEYDGMELKGLKTVVLSVQHDPHIIQSHIKEAAIEEILKPVLSSHFDLDKVNYHINPSGQFIIGGPEGDCGLTGRKIIVDTYGGFSRHGGGAFSGKDPSKVDRSGAYAARYVAKNLVAAGIADQCEVQIAYAIGIAKPISIYVNSFGSSKFSDQKIENCIRSVFDLSPFGINKMLNLKRPIYQPTAAFGHFGRDDQSADFFSWEKTDQVKAIKSYFS